MIWVARQLFAPIKYLRIRHGDSLLRSKRVYDFVLPGIFSACTCGTFWILGFRLSVFDHNELVKRILDLLALMIVFYVAALAAVATFERKGIDNPLRGGDAVLRVRNHDGGGYFDKKLDTSKNREFG